MTYEERVCAVLVGNLSPEILSDEEILDLQERVMLAITAKLDGFADHETLQ